MSYKPAFQNEPHVHCDLIKAWADGATIQELGYTPNRDTIGTNQLLLVGIRRNLQDKTQ